MKKTLLLVTLFLVIFTEVHTQTRVWAKLFQYFNPIVPGDNISGGIFEDSLGNLYLAGGEFSNLIKTDPEGNVIWIKTHEEDFISEDLISAPNGDLLVVGNKTLAKDSFVNILMRISPEGELRWKRGINSNFTFQQLSVTPTGTISIFSSEKTDTAFIHRISPFGEIQDSFILEDAAVSRMVQINSGKYFLSNSLGLTALDQDGRLLWQRESLFNGQGIAKAPNGSLVVLGMNRSNSLITLSNYDTIGNLIWQKAYPELSGFSVASFLRRNLAIDSNGNITFTPIITQKGTVYIIKTNSKGDIICLESYSYPWNNPILLKDMEATNDLGFLLLGHVRRENQFALAAIKTDSLCQFSEDPATIFIDPKLQTVVEDTIYAFNFKMHYFPNPADTELNFELEITRSLSQSDMQLFIHDAIGRLIYRKRINDFKYSLDTEYWGSGLHHISIFDKGQRLATGKVIIIHH